MHPQYTPEQIARFWSKVDKSGDCWIWIAGRIQTGYGSFYANGRSHRANRVAYEIATGPIPEGMFVCHRCDNPSCVRPDHLWLGSAAENSADMVAKGRAASGDQSPVRLHPESRPRGEKHHAAKVTAETVKAIRARYVQGGVTQMALAALFSLDQTTISDIIRRRSWRHL